MLGTSRSSVRRGEPAARPSDDALRARVRDLARQRPRFGYRRSCALARAEGHQVNHKRVARLCREEGLRVRGNARKRRRVGTSTADQSRLAAQRPDQVWALDYQFDATADGRQLKLLNIVDEFTREALAITVARSIDADATVAALESVVAARGAAPAFVRMDNGPELTSAALRDELLSGEVFDTLVEAKILIKDWLIDYNWKRPHSALGNQPPAVFAATCSN